MGAKQPPNLLNLIGKSTFGQLKMIWNDSAAPAIPGAADRSLGQ